MGGVDERGANESIFRIQTVGHYMEILSIAGSHSSGCQLFTSRRLFDPLDRAGSLSTLHQLAGHRLDGFGNSRQLLLLTRT